MLAHTDLAEVMQQARVAKLLELLFGQANIAVLADGDLGHRVGQTTRQPLHAPRVTGRGRVSLLDRCHARLHEAVEQRLDRVEKGLVVDGDGGLARYRLDHLQVLGPEADDLLLDRVHGQLHVEASLGVDELNRADDLVVVVAHRHRQHRLGAVAVLRIESAPALRLARGRVVSVVIDLAGAHRDRVADHALFVHRDLERLVCVVDREVLARGQEQLGHVVVDGLEPQACAVGIGQLAHRGEDELLQLVDVALGRKGDADAVQLLELTVLAPGLLLELPDVQLEHRVLQRDAQELAQGGRRRVGGRPDRDVLESFRRCLAGRQHDDRRGCNRLRVTKRGALESELGEHCTEPSVSSGREVNVEAAGCFHCIYHRPSEFCR